MLALLLAQSMQVCTPGAPELQPAWATQLRPLATAQFSYPLAALHRRVEQLLALSDGQLSRETIERIFAIPPMTTVFDDPRSATYAMLLKGAGGWTLRIDYTETYYPARGPAEFTLEPRPRRLRPNRRAEQQLRVLLSPAEAPSCLDSNGVLAGMRRLGWREAPPVMVMDAGLQHGGFRRGKRMLASIDDMPGRAGARACVTTVTLGEAQPPR